MKTRHQEIMEKNDATKDSPFVVMGLQCNGMTVSQGKIVQKPPVENSPNVAKSDTNQPGIPLVPSAAVQVRNYYSC